MEARTRTDNWTSLTTGLGTSKDKSTSLTRTVSERLPYNLLEAIYEDPMGKRIVDIIPWYASKDGYDIIADKTIKDLMEKAQTELDIDAKCVEAWQWARLYGGAACVLGVRDGLDPNQPIGSPRSVDFIQVVDRTEISPQGVIEYSFGSKAFGLPSSYQVSPVNGSPMVFHHSRIVRFIGNKVPRRMMAREDYWGQSIFVSLYNSLKRYGATLDGVSSLAADFRQTVFTLQNLDALLASGQEELVEKRFAVVESVRSMINALVLGSGEEMRSETATIAGLPDLVDRVILRLCSDTGIPHTILLGESPSGLGATGESERADFADLISTYQANYYERALRQIYDVVLSAAGKPNAEYEIKFRPIWKQPPEKEAVTRKTIAETDAIYEGLGLDPLLILKSRFGGLSFNAETNVPDQYFEELQNEDPIASEPDSENTPPVPGTEPGAQPIPPDPGADGTA